MTILEWATGRLKTAAPVSAKCVCRRGHRGFTIVELLIVIVVIAILAAVTIVAYNGIQDRANDSSVRSDLRMITKKLELARVDDSRSYYPIGNPQIAAAAPGIRVTEGAYKVSPDVAYNLLFCWPNTSIPNDFALLATSKSGKRFYTRNSGDVVEYTGATSWGAASSLAGICGSVLGGSTASGAGYSSGDTTTGPWRSWTGV